MSDHQIAGAETCMKDKRAGLFVRPGCFMFDCPRGRPDTWRDIKDRSSVISAAKPRADPEEGATTSFGSGGIQNEEKQ